MTAAIQVAGEVVANPTMVIGGVLAAVLGFAWHAEWLLLIPLLFVAVALVQREKRRRGNELPLVLPHPMGYSDTEARRAVERLVRAREGLGRSARSAVGVSRVLAGVTEIERRVLALAARLEYLGGFLETQVDGKLERDLLARLKGADAESSEEGLRAAYKRAADDRAVQLNGLDKLRAEYDLVVVTLDHLLATLEGVPVKLTQVRLMEIEACSGEPADANAAVDRLAEQIDLLEEVLADGPGAGADTPAGVSQSERA